MNVTKLLSQILVGICLGIFALSALAGNCDNPRYASKNPLECSDPPPDPPGQKKRLKVTVYYGDEVTASPAECETDENKNKCISTTFEVEGTVTCSSQVCDFSRTNEEGGLFLTPNKPLGIPPSQFNLLALTSIRGTDIVPAFCFDTQNVGQGESFEPENPPTDLDDYDDVGSTLEAINGFWLRSPVVSTADDEQKWWAHVWALSDDMNGVQRQYRFNFGGECNLDGGRCPMLRDGDFGGHFGNGFAGGVFGENTNQRGEGQTCRCTVSSKPGCPDHVNMGDDVPRPASWITIVDVTPE